MAYIEEKVNKQAKATDEIKETNENNDVELSKILNKLSEVEK